MSEDINVVADRVVADIQSLQTDLKNQKVSNLKDVYSLVSLVVKFLEKEAKDGNILASDKKALAVLVLNKLIDIPYLPEWLEGRAIGYLVDMAVEFANKNLGKDWISRINLA